MREGIRLLAIEQYINNQKIIISRITHCIVNQHIHQTKGLQIKTEKQIVETNGISVNK